MRANLVQKQPVKPTARISSLATLLCVAGDTTQNTIAVITREVGALHTNNIKCKKTIRCSDAACPSLRG